MRNTFIIWGKVNFSVLLKNRVRRRKFSKELGVGGEGLDVSLALAEMTNHCSQCFMFLSHFLLTNILSQVLLPLFCTKRNQPR